MKKKILILAEGYFPAQKYGGPPVSILNFCHLLKDKYNFYIVTRDNDINENERLEGITEGWNNREEAQVMYLNRKKKFKKNIEDIIKEINPDLIYINSFFDYNLMSAVFSKKNNIPLLIAPRGQLLEGARSNKPIRKKVYIELFKLISIFHKHVYFQSTSDEEELILKKTFSSKNIISFTNIPSISKMANKKNKQEESLNLVFLSRIVPKKNLDYAIEILKTLDEEVSLDIFGPIEDKSYWEFCQKKISNLPANVKVSYKGSLNHEDIDTVFRNYDAFLFPTKSENYGHVISESLTNGCPVIISDRTPWNDIENGKEGYVCSLENIEEFRKAIKLLYKLSSKEYQEMQKNIKIFIDSRVDFSLLKEDISSKLEKTMSNN
ncbi:TPA: glycosyltransferase [Enterococcus faecium]|uniref:glycosyltransferase n=1 Tax=Enterococcus faecium TaxID=1352 RepID=UPI0005C4905B|nr:glycosyltransferase [Enterococcus faecium]KNB91921.1 glycosyl transferase family 1 [Enterococcus faecium]